MTAGRLTGAVLLTAALIGSVGCGTSESSTGYATQLSQRVATDAVMAHLQRLQNIADANGGTRQTGTPGYAASVDYLVKALQDKGFDVQTPEFELGVFRVSAESLTLNGSPVTARAVEYSGATPATGVAGPLVAAPTDDTPGCQPSDYDGVALRGAVVLVDRGSCYLSDKAAAAASRGAVGLLIADSTDEKAFSAALTEADHVSIPVMWVSKADGARLRTQKGVATVVVDARVQQVRSRNVIAQTKTGSTENVVVAGAHLDSVRLGPGIDDNGSGVAVVLETALQMGSSPPVADAVRFAFWGGEEEFLLGSIAYVRSQDVDALKDIAMYLNFDMLGSPNPGYLTLDGDISSRPDPELGIQIPEGSAGIERAFVDSLAGIGTTANDLVFDGRGDYNPFALAGIPVGALCTGNEEIKTPEQAQLWGGQPGQPFDPNYHSADDTLANVNRAALDITGPAVAYVIGRYAQDQSGRYGVPTRGDRTRHLLEPT